jgi:hypothetical protein
MINIFKLIGYGMKAKQGYSEPDDLLADSSFGIVEGFFILSFVILGLISGILLYFGFSYGYSLMTFFGFLFLLMLFVDIAIYRIIKKAVQRISTKVTNTVKKQVSSNRTVDVEANEVK